MACCHSLLLRVPHTPLSWDQALFLSPRSQFVVEPVSPFLLLDSWSFVVLGCYPSAPCCCLLKLTWMLPGSLLRYHEQKHGSVVSAVAVRAFSCTVGYWLTQGPNVAQNVQVHNRHVGNACCHLTYTYIIYTHCHFNGFFLATSVDPHRWPTNKSPGRSPCHSRLQNDPAEQQPRNDSDHSTSCRSQLRKVR